MNVSYAVVAHRDRLEVAVDLAMATGAVICLDDGRFGCDDNHLRAWRAAYRTDADWIVVLEDDALPTSDDFVEQVESALTVAPTGIVSLYLGQHKPHTYQQAILGALTRARKDATVCWATHPRMFHAVAVAMRTDLAATWLEWARMYTGTLPIDQRLAEFASASGEPVGYTIPSLVEHCGDESLVGTVHNVPRRAWRTGFRNRWTDRSVNI